MTEAVAFPQDRSCPYHPPTGYRPLAARDPLAKVTLFDGREVWAVTGHAEARRLLIDPRMSSDRTNPAFPRTNPAVRQVRTPITAALAGVDDPVHKVQRRMLIPSFTLNRINGLRPRIQETVDQLLDAMVANGSPTELVGAFAQPLPSMTLCHLLGVPYEDHDFFEEQTIRLTNGPRPLEAKAALMGYLDALIDKKRQEPGEGLFDDLVHQQFLPGNLEREVLLELVWVLLVAGHDTSANMISLGTFTLLQHPERLAELRADLSLVPAAVEELLRYLTIADGLPRVATADIEVGGTTIRKDDGVVFLASLINRDGDLHERPDELDWHRSHRDHFSFGFGIHQCLGQNLARALLEIAFRSLLERLPGLRLAVPAQEVPFKLGQVFQGMVELPVAW
ncbi:cytochrome P450 [Streptomyces leeuwenhoekii]|uniref:Cytochrome P450 n=1 Tax=Streptomyces leeuwenhoekii TaxID=1437453 RepID=A0ABR5HTF7_STRLW|nr:cytochrome P450 [Streptomyces leeuwenhoekii]KMS71987.1 cytochrome P450 [Streptomyces leeuwenhoekii]